MTELATRSAEGSSTPFEGVFHVAPISQGEKVSLQSILEKYQTDETNVPEDLKSLSALTSEVKAISNQAVILHGERIKKAQTLLRKYRDGAFSNWLLKTYGNRQTPYNFMQYFELYSSLPKKLQGIVDEMPRQAIYSLSSRAIPYEKKEAFVEEYQGESKTQLLEKLRKSYPLAKKDKRRLNQYNFDKSVIDEIISDAPNMSRKMILEKYGDRISKKKLDSLKLKFGIVEESGRPRIPVGERSPKQVKRVNRIRNAQGFDVSGTFAKNFHHIFPIGGLSELSAQDVMILDKKFNETLGGFNLQLNDIADEIATMDLSDPNALKKLNDLNVKSKDLVNRAKAKLPKELQNAIGYIEYNPVFDENGTIFELSQVRKGVDAPMGSLPAEFGTKKFKDYTPEEIKKFKNRVKQLAIQAGDEGAMFAANPFFNPGILKEAFKQLPTPAGAVALNLGFGVDPRSSIDRASIAAEAAFAPALVKQAAKLGSVGQRIANLGLSPTTAMRIARVASPLGIASLGLEGAYQYGKFVKDELDRIKQMTPEEREAYNIEQQEQMGVSAAEGGLIGDKSGPPPERGPNPQGLLSLKKRGMKI